MDTEREFTDICIYEPRLQRDIMCLYTGYRGIIIQYFNTKDKLILTPENQIFSKYALPGHYMAISKLSLNIPNDHMIVGIGYDTGDIQLSITGSKKIKEKTINSALREVREELGLILDRKHLNYLCTQEKSSYNKPGRTVHYSVDIDALDGLVMLQENIGIIDSIDDEEEDDYSKKVSVIIHGSHQKLSKLIANAKPTDTSEVITFYSLVPLDVALRVIFHIDNKEYMFQ